MDGLRFVQSQLIPSGAVLALHGVSLSVAKASAEDGVGDDREREERGGDPAPSLACEEYFGMILPLHLKDTSVCWSMDGVDGKARGQAA